jgi:hypothetical protein
VLAITKKICVYTIPLLAFCFFPHASAHAQSGYVSPNFYPYQIKLGQSVTLFGNPDCSPGIGHPSANFSASTTPDTVGSSIGEVNYGENSIGWTPSQAGTYYISEYVSSNGANCSGLEPEPEFETLTVTSN